MKAIILAAGMGKRLSEKTNGLPKSMIQIGERTIIEHQIKNCLEFGIQKFIIVVGYKKEILKEHILKFLNKDQVAFIENKIYESTNTLYSLWLTRDHFDSDFIYFNADVLFHKDLLGMIIHPSPYSQLLIQPKSCGTEEVKVIIDPDKKILEIGKDLEPEKCAGEFIGIAKFKRDILSEFLKAIQYGIEQKQENNYFEYAVNLLSKKVALESVSTGDLPCIEIDFPEDLIRARKMFN